MNTQAATRHASPHDAGARHPPEMRTHTSEQTKSYECPGIGAPEICDVSSIREVRCASCPLVCLPRISHTSPKICRAHRRSFPLLCIRSHSNYLTHPQQAFTKRCVSGTWSLMLCGSRLCWCLFSGRRRGQSGCGQHPPTKLGVPCLCRR